MGDKIFLITGATSGLGRAMKLYLLRNTDYNIISLSRKKDKIDIENPRISFIKLDLEDDFNLEYYQKFFSKWRSKKFIFINNAATVMPVNKIGNLDFDLLKKSINTNVTNQFKLINFFVSLDISLKIIHISTGAATKPIRFWGIYCSTKAALEMFLKVLALESSSIDIKIVDPGLVDTPMQQLIRSTNFPDNQIFVSAYENNRVQSPEVVVQSILSSEL